MPTRQLGESCRTVQPGEGGAEGVEVFTWRRDPFTLEVDGRREIELRIEVHFSPFSISEMAS